MSTPQTTQNDPDDSRLGKALADVLTELRRAEAKFPGQHLPDGTPAGAERIGLEKALVQARAGRDMYRRITDGKLRRGTATWWDVLREEVFEAGAEHEPAALRAELIQVAAMALRWITDIDLGPDRPMVCLPAAAPEQDGRERKAAQTSRTEGTDPS